MGFPVGNSPVQWVGLDTCDLRRYQRPSLGQQSVARRGRRLPRLRP